VSEVTKKLKPVAEADFRVAYDGPAIEGGRMAVRDLAPALLALGELVSDASAIVQPEKGRVGLEIEATEEGSFAIHLILSAPLGGWDQVVNMFSSDGVTALVNLKELLIAPSIGIFWFVKRMRGRSIRQQQQTEQAGITRLILDDETSIELPNETLRLYQSVTVRKQVSTVVAPLKQKGISSIRFGTETETEVRIESGEIDAFEAPEIEDKPLGDREYVTALSIASVAFSDGNKWRLSDGENTFYVSMEDGDFRDDVDRGLAAFRKGDILRCRIHETQVQSQDGLHTSRTVLEVIEHIPMEVQIPLLGQPESHDD
jgi:hypothetical protein